MSTENKKRATSKKTNKPFVSNTVRDYGNDPFFVKKTRDSKIFLEKNGFPDEIKKRFLKP